MSDTVSLNPLKNARRSGGGGGGVEPGVIEQLEEDVERALQGNHVYTTEERIVGEWIDGGNIYETVLVFENSLAISNESGVLISDTMQTIIDRCLKCRALGTDGYSAELGTYTRFDLEGLYCYGEIGRTVYAKEIILQYTKKS